MSDADRIVGIYQRHAGAWDRLRGRGLFERGWLDKFSAHLPVGGAVLDLGCGGGEPIARHLTERGLWITGVDTSEPLLALARQRLPDHTWIAGDMRGLDLGRRYDGVVAWDSFFHLTADDQRRMFPVFARHLHAGGVLLFTSGPRHGEAIGQFEGEPLYHASLAPDEYRLLLATSGFRVVDHVADDPACGFHTVWLAQHGRDGI
jgi:SAM-dependent methyltransferase